MALLLVACNKEYDDTDLRNRVTTLETKIGNLEAQMKAVQTVALGQYVQKVEQTAEGVTVTYGNGDVVTLKISATPSEATGVLSVMKNSAGELCWAIDGKILQVDGKDLTLYQTPSFEVKNGHLYVTVGGKTTDLGEFAGGSVQDGLIKDIKKTDTKLIITLNDNSTIEIPLMEAFRLVIAKTQYAVTSTDPIEIPYTIQNKTQNTVVDVFTDANFEAAVDAQKITITPLAVTKGQALAYADSQVGFTSIVKLTFGAEAEPDYATVTDEPYSSTVDYMGEAKDGSVEVHVVSNAAIDVKSEADWITIQSVKATSYTVTLALADNPAEEIRTGVVKVYNAGTDNVLQTITVAQKAKEPEPDTRTWYNPAGWNKVFNMADYRSNTTFIWNNGLALTPGNLTLQWKFYSNKWNNHKFQDKDENNNQLYCNRLGEFANADESRSVLFRFSNDGSADGQLCLNASALGLGQDQVAKDGKPYVWPTGEWVVMTLVSNGNTLSIYHNDALIQSWTVNAPSSWNLQRFDLSMTWDDGSNWPLRQAFNGYSAYARVWSRALSESDITATLCEVPAANAEGLEIEWKFDGTNDKWVDNTVAKNEAFVLDFTDCQDGNGNHKDNSDAAVAAWTDLAGDISGLCYTKGGETPENPDPENPDPDQPQNPEGWEYVFNMSNYEVNSTHRWQNGLELNPSAITYQWKFYANKWNNHKFQDKAEAGYTLYCNRLGEMAGYNEENALLLRFSNDGDADGQLCLNAGFLGVNQDQVKKDGKPFVWPTGEWVVLTIVSDGAKVSLYCNDELVTAYNATPTVSSWTLGRYDLSMTWDDGSNWPRSQAFNGYMAYTRVWSRALGVEDIAATLCEIPTDKAEGLEICWNFDGKTTKWVDNAVAKNEAFALDFSDCWDGNNNTKDVSAAAEAAWTKLADSELPGTCAKGTSGTDTPDNPDPENPDPENPDPENPDPENPDPENPDPDQPDNRTWYTPAGWEKVFDMSNYEVNSTHRWQNGLELNPSALTIQYKFFANKWNNHKFQDKAEAGYTLYCNRLGEMAGYNEENALLLRFSNDGDADGQLCLNAGFLGVNQDQVKKDGKPFVWPTGEWVVLTIVSDGSKVSLYCNDELVTAYNVAPTVASWTLGRFDLSMTWDDGSNWPRSQAFNGYIAYARVWSRALAVSDITATLCDVPAANKEGLECCWNFDGSTDKWVENTAGKNDAMALDFTDCWDGNNNTKDVSTAAQAAWTPLTAETFKGLCYNVQ